MVERGAGQAPGSTLARGGLDSAQRALADLDSERRAAISAAAQECFLRYGYARTRMEDVARAANVSRPNLYNYYPSKEAVFRAVIDAICVASLEKVRVAARGEGSVWARIEAIFDAWSGDHLRLVEHAPEAEALLETSRVVAADLILAAEAEIEATLARMLRAAIRRGEIALIEGLSVRALVDVLLSSSTGFKEGARPDLFQRRTRALVAALEAATRPRG